MPTTVETYEALVEGLFAARTVRPLTDTTEADLADVLDELWHRLSEKEQEALDPDLVERLKKKWNGRKIGAPGS